MELTNSLEKIQGLQLQIQAVILKITSFRTMWNYFFEEKQKIQDFMGNTNYLLVPCPSSRGQF
jgi:hypothetical protein